MSSGEVVQQSKTLMDRPARLQVDPESIAEDDKPPQTGNAFNIWYLKWSGGESSSKRNQIKSKFKVNIKQDTGYTRAKLSSPICLFFARGCCYRGKKCPYFHRIPLDVDSFLPTQDCFGRDKTAEYRDDMDGVGSFNKINRTLYIGGLHMKDNMENKIIKNFQPFGDIEKVRVLYNKSCAFVTFRLESTAQFVKEAMADQSLDNGNEVLYIRWSNEDPNPHAQRQEKRRLEEIAINTVKNLLESVQDSENKKRKVEIQVEEPEDEEAESENVHEIKQIEASIPVNHGITFNTTSLETLSKLRAKQIEKETKNAVANAIGGYSSDDDDDDA
ncbi:Pre-mRNA-splicing factor CWC2 [Scheffersomyces coipomensis]|uniref:Pre-mRNA-splicing factor CWC2 n=1 Tax=Scheffersomyces coipomensis TaxID=1788519 RepID=UPI00315C917A